MLWMLVDACDELIAHAPIPAMDIVHRVGVDDVDELPACDGVAIVAGSMRGLLQCEPALERQGRVKRFEVYVEGVPSATPITVPTVALLTAAPKQVSVLTEHTPVAHTHLTVRTSRVVAARDLLAGALGRQPSAVVPRGSRTSRSVGEGWGWSDLATVPRLDLERALATVSEADPVCAADLQTLSPAGLFRVPPARAPGDHTARLVRNQRAEGWEVVTSGQALVTRIPGWLGLTDTDVASMRGLREVSLPIGATSGPQETARLVVQGAVAAVPVVPERIDPITARLLGPDLTRDLKRFSGVDVSDDIAFESWLMDFRRSAFIGHADHPVVGRRNSQGRRKTSAEPWVTVILATMRPEFLPWILDQLERQSWGSFDVVVGLHGGGADLPIVKSAVAEFSRPIKVLEISQSLVLGEALQLITDHAEGDYIAKVDDDDWYGVHHLTDLMHALAFSGATIVGSGAEFIYLAELDMTVRRHSRMGHAYTRLIAGSTLMLRREDHRAVGGWTPVPRAVDTALIDSVLGAGGLPYRSHGLGFVVYRAPNGHTWNPGPAYFLRRHPPQWRGFYPPPHVEGRRPDAHGVTSWFDRHARPSGN